MTRYAWRGPLALAPMLAIAVLAAPAALAQNEGPGLPPSPPPAPASTPPAKHIPGPPGVAAVVNGERITIAEVKDRAFVLDGPTATQQLIVLTLINQEAARQKITVTPAEIEARIAEARKAVAGQIPGGLDAALAQRGETMAQFREAQHVNMLVEKLVSKSLTPVKLIHTRHILVLTKAPAQDPTVKVHTEAEAQAILAKAQADLKAGKPFADVAKTYSEDPGTKDKGGDDGWISQTTNYIPEFITAAFALKPGETTTINTPEFGYFIIQSEGSGAPVAGADKIAYTTAVQAARQQQLSQAAPAFLKKLRQDAKITDYVTP